MISEEGRDPIVDAVEQRKIELEREFLVAAGKRRGKRLAKIASDIEACRTLLVRLEQSPSILKAIETHKAALERFTRACSTTDEVVAHEQGRTITSADMAEHESANEAEEDALALLIGLPTPTQAAVRAKLAYLATLSDSLSFPEVAARALERIVE
jgi:hypothetical protein